MNNDPAGRNLDHLIVSVDCTGGKLQYGIEVFGRCTPTPCPWGVRQAVVANDQTLAAHFDFGFAIKDISAWREAGHLHVVTATKFTDKSGRQPRVSIDDLVMVK